MKIISDIESETKNPDNEENIAKGSCSPFVHFIILFRFRSSMSGLLYKDTEIVIN